MIDFLCPVREKDSIRYRLLLEACTGIRQIVGSSRYIPNHSFLRAVQSIIIIYVLCTVLYEYIKSHSAIFYYGL